jgi:hypothetical protein
MHLPQLLARVAPLRPFAPSSCEILVFMVWRWPPSQYVSNYHFQMREVLRGRRPMTAPFESFARANPNFQADDLIRGAWQFKRVKRYTGAQLEPIVLELLRSFDAVAPFDRLDALRELLCKRLALPRCPPFPTALAADGDFNARTDRLATRLDKPQLRAAEQRRLMGDEVALRNLTQEIAWLDHRIYEWCTVDFAHRLRAEGLAAPQSAWSLL